MMIEQLLPFAEYLKEKTLFPTVKRILNFCFVLSISSFLFEKIYFKYSLLDITDYKGQFEFIAHGKFFVPFSIFFLVWAGTNLLGLGLFTTCNYLITEKYQGKIIKYSSKKNATISQLKKTEKMIQKKLIIKPDKEWFVMIYESFKSSFTQKEYEHIMGELAHYKQKLTSDSILVFRALLAVFIYFSIVPYFGWLLLILLLITLFSFVFLLVLGYQIAELLPTVIQKVVVEMEQYIKDKYPTNE